MRRSKPVPHLCPSVRSGQTNSSLMGLLLLMLAAVAAATQCGVLRVTNCSNAGMRTCLSSFTYVAGRPTPCVYGVHDDCIASTSTCSNICTCPTLRLSCDFLIPAEGCAPYCVKQREGNTTFLVQCGTSVTICYRAGPCVPNAP